MGLDGLSDKPRPGMPHKRDPEKTRRDIMAALLEPPPNGEDSWDGWSLSEKLGISARKLWRVLKSEGISLKRKRRWVVNADIFSNQVAIDLAGLTWHCQITPWCYLFIQR
jgi:transposase